jgi:predicted TIM-barrel fold metal-dependent hydrolase
MILDGMMHLEVYGDYWEGLIDEVIEHYDAVGIDKGVVLTTWTPSRESNDRTRQACQKYPERFIPFGHVRPVDAWQDELKRVTQEFGWTGLKLHQGELQAGGPDMKATTRAVVARAAELGIRIVKIHLVDYAIMEELTREIPEITWILPHMGCYGKWDDMQRYCELARDRANVYLDTCAVAPYYDLGKGIEWAGVQKVTFASDGHQFSPLVELAKIKTLQLPTPFRTPLLTDEELGLILGGTMATLLGI